MKEAFIVDAVRTPVGRKGGTLADVHPLDLGATALMELINRTGVDPDAVDDVILGCVDAVGPQGSNVARSAWLAAGLPEHIPGVTVDRRCGSSQQAIQFAVQAVLSGTQDVVVAGGLQSMSTIPISTAYDAGVPLGFSDAFTGSSGWRARYGRVIPSQFEAADMIAKRWSIEREALDRFAADSHDRALAAQSQDAFVPEIVPLRGLDRDECPRAVDFDKIKSLKPLLPDGRHTAASASSIADGSAAVLVVNERALRTHNLVPKARVHHVSVHAGDPMIMLTVPIAATEHALRQSGLSLDDIDLFEVNEAFSSVVLAWLQEVAADPAKVNVSGGAIALGHPLGATGARLTTTLIHGLERRGGRYGLQAMCEAGGQANVMIIERLAGVAPAEADVDTTVVRS